MGSIKIAIPVFLIIVGFICTYSKTAAYLRRSKCQPLRLSSCQKLGYNQTRVLDDMYPSMPARELQQYIKLIDDIRCSPDALFFLCTIYSPVCFEAYVPRVLPCRSVCEKVKKGCLPYVKIAGFSWPTELECDGLPEYSTGVCIRPSAIISSNGKKVEENQNTKDPGLPCPKCKPQHELKRYKQFKRASYVIEAEVKSRITSAKGETKLTAYIKKIYKQGHVKITKGSRKILSPTRCLCPDVEFDKSLIILGQEDKRRGKLLFDVQSIVVKASKQMSRKMQKWKRKYDRHIVRKLKKKQKQP